MFDAVQKLAIAHEVSRFKILFTPLFQCSDISFLLRASYMFKMYHVWLIEVRSISSKVVVFLWINSKEKLAVRLARMYLGLIK